MPDPVTAWQPARASPAGIRGLRCRVRIADGRVFAGDLAPERHRALLHANSDGLVELAAGARRDGRLQITTRKRADHFLPGGEAGEPGWLTALLALAACHADRGQEVFIAPAVREAPRGEKHAVAHTRCLWIDVDQPGQLPALWAFLAERPCRLLVETAGSGGVHAYFQLAEELPATRVVEATGELVEPIEHAHLRIIHHLGVGADGKPNVADPQCAERSRVTRLAGTINGKTGRHARIVEADFALPAYSLSNLVGELPDPSSPTSAPATRAGRRGDHQDAYKRISPPDYFEKLAGVTVPRDGLVRCPATWHEDEHPSCSVGMDASTGWKCHGGSCGAGGAIYDLASVLLGGPYGQELRGEAFNRARAYVADVIGEPT